MGVREHIKKCVREMSQRTFQTPDLGKGVTRVPHNVVNSLPMMADPTHSSDS